MKMLMLGCAFISVAAAASTQHGDFSLRYIEYDPNSQSTSGSHWNAEVKQMSHSKDILFFPATGSEAKALSPTEYLPESSLLFQSPVYWRKWWGYSVDRTMVNVKTYGDLLPISTALVMMDKDCKASDPKKGLQKAFKQAVEDENGTPSWNGVHKWGGGTLPPWKVPFSFRFARRFFGSGEKVEVTCEVQTSDQDSDKTSDERPQKYAIATSGAVATDWEKRGCTVSPGKTLEQLMFGSLLARFFNVPVEVDQKMHLIHVPVLNPKKPTLCLLAVERGLPTVTGCEAPKAVAYQKRDLVFLQRPTVWVGEKLQVHVQKGSRKPAGTVYLVLRPQGATQTKKGGQVTVNLQPTTVTFADRGAWKGEGRPAFKGVIEGKNA